jgi:MinD superfamily P-loop ATPase
MRQIVLLSGKGGTGKTTITASFVHLAAQDHKIVIADVDVDASNLDLVLSPEVLETHDFASGVVAKIDPDDCISCDICRQVCRFDAIDIVDDVYTVDKIACDGCAACFYQCPVGAISLEEPVVGRWFKSQTRFGPMVHAHLFAGQENSGKLVTLVKQEARLIALDENREYVIIDGPPGIGCPVISAVSGAHAALIVVEPTVSGIHDLKRALETADHFRVPSAVVINKADINERRAEEIEEFCARNDIQMLGRLPFDTVVTEAMVHRMPVTEYAPERPISQKIASLWKAIKSFADSVPEEYI